MKINKLDRKDTLQRKIVNWLSRMTPKDVRQFSRRASIFLEAFIGIKEYPCRIRPCREREYSRSLCQKHYNFFRFFTKAQYDSHSNPVSWGEIVGAGFATGKDTPYRPLLREVKRIAPPNDPLEAIIRKN